MKLRWQRARMAHFSVAALVLLGGGFSSSCGTTATKLYETNLAFHLSDAKQLPTGFATYTFFLVTSGWESEGDAATALTEVEQGFKKFGDTIGDKNLAVWVTGSDGRLSLSLGRHYADAFSQWAREPLNYNEGPFVVVTDTHPSLLAQTRQRTIVIVSLKGLSAQRTRAILNNLELSIRREQISTRQLTFQVFCARLTEWWEKSE
ncbi:MAG TPA: hypothetical protein VHO24_10850, partial [Opitutaceae bacterium]|nr:hypothetical protein [Opitutaceae bacterium]